MANYSRLAPWAWIARLVASGLLIVWVAWFILTIIPGVPEIPEVAIFILFGGSAAGGVLYLTGEFLAGLQGRE